MNPFEHTLDVSLELSNLCQYAWFHKKCPLHLEMETPFVVRTPKILPASIVYKVLDTLAKYDYGNEINFHQYSEPLLDPRLFEFIRYARRACPESKITILTNGHYLTTGLAEELALAGVSQLLVSLYRRGTEWADNLVMQCPSNFCHILHHGDLDDRLSLYDQEPGPVPNSKPCYAPLAYLGITRDAKVSLCCFDWKRHHTFGSLLEQSLEKILVSDKVQETYQRLSSGDRFLALCRRCPYSRGVAR
jgi:MoaA/NifB/PqqE/SkfB family radical SAM enzyme